jgi:hypothetical protein
MSLYRPSILKLRTIDALEHLVLAQGLGTAEQIHRLEHAWEAAAVRTPHGQPIEIQAQDFTSA